MPAAGPSRPAPLPDDDSPLLLEELPSGAEGSGGLFEPDPDDDLSSGSAMAQLRNKKGLSAWMFIIPLLGIAAAGGIVFAYLKAAEPKFVGSVEGERIALKKPIAVTITWQEAGAGPEEQKVIRSLLDKTPLPVATPIMVVSFLSDSRGIAIEAKNGYDTDIIRVDPHQIPILANWLLRNAERLQINRSATVTPAAQEFAARLAPLIQNHQPIKSSDFAEFRDRLALPALNRTLGHWCGAVVDGRIYPCVYEDPQGLLYFAVPTSARFFEVRETGNEPGRVLPPTFALSVSLPPRAAVESLTGPPLKKGEAEEMPEEPAKEKPAESASDK